MTSRASIGASRPNATSRCGIITWSSRQAPVFRLDGGGYLRRDSYLHRQLGCRANRSEAPRAVDAEPAGQLHHPRQLAQGRTALARRDARQWLSDALRRRLREPPRPLSRSSCRQAFRHCTDSTNLCIACRTFGMLNRGDIFLGKVNIGDAVSYPGRVYQYDAIYTAVLVEPKPRHEAFYLDERRQHITGRKFYFHHSNDNLLTEKQLKYFGRNQEPANRYIQPLDRRIQFPLPRRFHQP